MSNEDSSNYTDPWSARKPPDSLEVAHGGEERPLYRAAKSLFADFIPSVVVYNAHNAAAAGDKVFETTRVIFEGVQESTSEAMQLLKTFQPNLEGKDVSLTFFGEKPRIYSFSGSFFHLNTKQKEKGTVDGITPDTKIDGNWYDSFRYAYDTVLRGSKCAELGLQVRVNYDYRWSQGYLLNFTSTFAAGSPGVVPFNFSMVVGNSGLYHKEADISSKTIISGIASK